MLAAMPEVKTDRKSIQVLPERINPRLARASKKNPRRIKGFLRLSRSDQTPRGMRRMI
jgi:hypothetical protein